MLKNEIIKIFSKKSFVVFIIIVLIINGSFIYWGEIKTDEFSQVTYKEYLQLNEDIKYKTDEEKKAYIIEKLEILNKMKDFLVYLEVPDMYIDYFTTEELIEFEKKYESGDYIKYTSNIYDEIILYKEMLEEVMQTINYPQILKQIIKNSNKVLKKAGKDTFEYNRASAIIEKYNELENVKPYHNASRGINLFLDNTTTDFLIVICIMFATVIAINYERENNLIILSKTTVNGRTKHGGIKVAVLFVVGLFTIALMYGETFVISSVLYGMGALSRPIQSVVGYSLCSLDVSVGQYILLYILYKYIFYIMCGALFFFLCTILKKATSVYGISGLIIAGLIWGYNSISNASYLVNFKLFNPVSFGKTDEILSRIRYIDIFGMAIEQLWVYVVCMVVTSVILFLLGVYFYAVSNEKETARFEIKSIFRRKGYHTNLFLHELNKTFISYRVIIIHIVGILVVSVLFIPTESIKGNLEDYRYNMYVKGIEGKYTEDTRTYIDAQIALLNKEMEEYGGNESDRKYLNLKLSRNIVEEVDRYLLYLSEKENSYFINNEGYLMLTDGTNLLRDNNIVLAISALLLTILCHTASLSADFIHKEDRLIYSTSKGRRKYYIYKFVIAIISVTTIYGTIYLPQLINVLKSYGMEFFGAPAYSLQHLSRMPACISIGTYIVFRYTLRYVMLLLSYFIVFYFIKKLRSSGMVVLISISIFVGPLVLYFLGVELLEPCIRFWL